MHLAGAEQTRVRRQPLGVVCAFLLELCRESPHRRCKPVVLVRKRVDGKRNVRHGSLAANETRCISAAGEKELGNGRQARSLVVARGLNGIVQSTQRGPGSRAADDPGAGAVLGKDRLDVRTRIRHGRRDDGNTRAHVRAPCGK